MKLFAHIFDNIGLHILHKNKSIGSQFNNSDWGISVDDLHSFYSTPKTPDVKLLEEKIIGNYSVGKFKYESEVFSNISNRYASGVYYLNRDSKENINFIIVHGWRMDSLNRIYGMFKKNFMKEGYNMFYYTLPYHFEREPEESKFNGELMVGADVDRTLVSIKQTVSDLRALIYWLKQHKKGKVVLVGISLGGLMTNIMGVVEKEIDGLISLIYANSLAHSVFKTKTGIYIKQDYENNNFSYEELQKCWQIITPSNFKPIIPKEKILLMSGMYDKYVHMEDTTVLWEAWDRPKRLVYKCGHSGFIIKRKAIYKNVIKFIKGL